MVAEHAPPARPLTVGDAARAVIGQVAPDELPLFGELSAAYFRDPAGSMGLRAQRSKPTRFPGSGELELITGVVLGVLTNVLSDAATSAVTSGWGRLRLRREARKVRRAGPGALEQSAPVSANEAAVRAALAGLRPEVRESVFSALITVLVIDPATPGTGPAAGGAPGAAGEDEGEKTS